MLSIQTSLLVFFITGLLFSALSIPLIRKKVKMNAWYGIRTGETMSDEYIWYKVNSIMGKYLFAFGLIISALSVYFYFFPFNEEYEMVYTLLGVLMIGTILFVKQSFYVSYKQSQKYFKKLNESNYE